MMPWAIEVPSPILMTICLHLAKLHASHILAVKFDIEQQQNSVNVLSARSWVQHTSTRDSGWAGPSQQLLLLAWHWSWEQGDSLSWVHRWSPAVLQSTGEAALGNLYGGNRIQAERVAWWGLANTGRKGYNCPITLIQNLGHNTSSEIPPFLCLANVSETHWQSVWLSSFSVAVAEICVVDLKSLILPMDLFGKPSNST